jgi:hypothetical protein
MSIQVYSYGALLRIVNDGSVLLIAKSQIKTVEVIRDDTVKISIGEGTLSELLVKLSDVTVPTGILDVAALRDAISHMLDYSNGYEEMALTKQQLEIDQLIEIKQVLNLWHSTQQIDLNFQQLEVNALISISNRLVEEKENNQQILFSIGDQTLKIISLTDKVSDIKAIEESLITKQDSLINLIMGQSLQFTLMINKLTDISVNDQNLINKQDLLFGVLTDIKVIGGLIQAILTDILNELKSQTNKLSTIDTSLNDIRSQITSSLSKQDNQALLLNDIKQALSTH